MKTIETRYHGPTNTKGSKIIATDGDNRLTIHVNNALSLEANHMEAARLLKTRLAWRGSMQGGHTKRGMVWVFQGEYTCE